MDPELYVFPGIRSTPTKIAASTGLFIVVLVIAALLLPLLPGPQLWARGTSGFSSEKFRSVSPN